MEFSINSRSGEKESIAQNLGPRMGHELISKRPDLSVHLDLQDPSAPVEAISGS